jgi:predicted transcriptional regulator
LTQFGRIFAVLEEMVAIGEPIGPRALARAADIDRSAVSRILGHLTDIGIVEREHDADRQGAVRSLQRDLLRVRPAR